MHAELARFIRRRCDYAAAIAAADDDRLALQARIEHLLDRRIKGVHVDVEIPGHCDAACYLLIMPRVDKAACLHLLQEPIIEDLSQFVSSRSAEAWNKPMIYCFKRADHMLYSSRFTPLTAEENTASKVKAVST